MEGVLRILRQAFFPGRLIQRKGPVVAGRLGDVEVEFRTEGKRHVSCAALGVSNPVLGAGGGRNRAAAVDHLVRGPAKAARREGRDPQAGPEPAHSQQRNTTALLNAAKPSGMLTR
jgi:hypothetical protein